MYFNLAAEGRVFHFMGQLQERRHLLAAHKQVAIFAKMVDPLRCGNSTLCVLLGHGRGELEV